MATAPSRTELRSTGDGAGGPASRRDARLAELVAELAGCDERAALDAVRPHADADDPLEAVARALSGLRREHPEPQDRLRVAGFLRATDRRLPRRPRAGSTAPGDPSEHRLVHHGSLRRWDRTGVVEPDRADTDPGADISDDGQVIDLRDRTARFRRPAPGSMPS